MSTVLYIQMLLQVAPDFPKSWKPTGPFANDTVAAAKA